MKIPDKVYKYEDFTAQSLKNLKSQAIYFGSPMNFNDPYDCAMFPNIKNMTDNEVELIRKVNLSDKEIPDIAKDYFANMPTNELRGMLIRSCASIINDTVSRFQKESGATCFSETNEDLLMWSHYGGKYKGYCLEFSTSHRPFEKLKKVKYADRIPTLSAFEILQNNKYDHVENLFCIKSSSWKYEKEWRGLHKEAGTLHTYPAESLNGIYFGPDISLESLEIICLIIQGQNKNVKFWKGSRSKEEFKVNFEQFEYIPHVNVGNV